MANTQRRADYIDRNDNMFIPMNVEGGYWNDNFFTTSKLATMIAILVSLFFIIVYIKSYYLSFLASVLVVGTWFIISSLLVRFIIFEEKFYYKMYQELKEHEISTPALFWDIASMKDTEDGAILTYSDARIAIMVKVERDTITGKTPDFKEIHYDAVSDFYKEIMVNKYSFIQMNIMEQAGKDPRLDELSKIVYKSDNPNINKLMEMQVGYIKNTTRKSLYESDYFLFYTYDLSKIDSIIQDISECIYKLLDGAYIGFRVLNNKDIIDFVKEEYGVNYFNATEASLLMFNRDMTSGLVPFNITGLVWKGTTDDDAEENQTLNTKEINKLRKITSDVISETLSISDIALKEALYRKEIKKSVGVDFNKLSDVHVNGKPIANEKPDIRSLQNYRQNQQGNNIPGWQNTQENNDKYGSNTVYIDL